jgi:hypothetical protein
LGRWLIGFWAALPLAACGNGDEGNPRASGGGAAEGGVAGTVAATGNADSTGGTASAGAAPGGAGSDAESGGMPSAGGGNAGAAGGGATAAGASGGGVAGAEATGGSAVNGGGPDASPSATFEEALPPCLTLCERHHEHDCIYPDVDSCKTTCRNFETRTPQCLGAAKAYWTCMNALPAECMPQQPCLCHEGSACKAVGDEMSARCFGK